MSAPSPFATVTEIIDALKKGECTSLELVEQSLARIAQHDEKLHAFIDVYADEARQAARSADLARQAGCSLGPLHGVPVALKDLVEIEGRITTNGCISAAQRRSDHTATLVHRLQQAGVIILGKTHMVELATGGWGSNSRMGTPWNPWNLDHPRTPGGSSSGSAVAVAGGLVPWALGSDTGGSIRSPASWCNLTGLKVSSGRISNYGVIPLSPSLDTMGPMARSAADCRLLYDVLRGPDPLDPGTLLAPADSRPARRAPDLSGLRMAFLPEAERADVDAEILAAYDASLALLREAGAQLVPMNLPYQFAEVAELNGLIMSAEGYSFHHGLLDDLGADMDEHVRPRLANGRDISSRQYLQALYARRAMQKTLHGAFDEVDILLTPTTRTPALRLEDVDQTKAPSHFLRFANFFNLPALALPNGQNRQGLPLSLQLIGRPYDEATILHVGETLQRMTDWHRRTPPGLSG